MKSIITTFFIALVYCIPISAQTIIDYQAWTGASGCNIFSSSTNVPVIVNGNSSTIAHQSTIGQPTYNNGVALTCRGIFNSGGTLTGYHTSLSCISQRYNQSFKTFFACLYGNRQSTFNGLYRAI